ncbi:hypothetical protein ISS05_00455 [Candidatus Woesearchaeota archaeon]|nr:hypothetical protein [Candidatus Woesearchaeota archaeon]
MEIKETLSRLEASPEFKGWREKNKDDYFSYAFCKLDVGNEWQVGYYNKKNDQITTFVVNEKIEIMPLEEIFKKPDMKVNKVDLDKVKLTFAEIVDKASEFQKEKYSKEVIDKVIAILQNLEELGNVWNMTFITKAFKTLNVKIDAENGKVLEHKLSSIFDFRKG